MKKNILIFSVVLAAIALTAFGFIKGNDTATGKSETPCNAEASLNDAITKEMKPFENVELSYDIGSRYMNIITKEDLIKAKSYYDIIPKDLKRSIVSFSSVNVIILDDNYETVKSENGDNEVLNAAQIQLLQSVPYSTDILIRAQYKLKNKKTGTLENSRSTPHLTVVPEKQAVCTRGKDALIDYVKQNTNGFSSIVDEDELQPGKVIFTITKKGKIEDVAVTSTSGYPTFDKQMVQLVSGLPGTWEPATNYKGEKVDQKFVFSFGIIGC